jgi:DDE superfamily endonuclease
MWTQATRDQVAAIEKKTKRYPSDLKNQHEAAAGRSAVIGSKRRHHMAVGRPRPFLAALRHDRVVAPWLIDGSINGATFQLMSRRSWFRHCALRRADIVIMDNLGSHKGKVVRRVIRAAGARLFYLPNYSPDLNPSSSCSPSLSIGIA